jgi:hypothetical protein
MTVQFYRGVAIAALTGAIAACSSFPVAVSTPNPGSEVSTGLTAEQEAARRQYDEIPLATLFPELPVIHPDAEVLAFETFGRTQLSEGEQATEIELIATYDNYQVLMLTNFGAGDDSIGGVRYRLEFESFDNDQTNLIWVGEQRYCSRALFPGWTNQLCP